MQITSDQRVVFYKRVAVSASFFLLLFSLAFNIFLFTSRAPKEKAVPKPVVEQDPFFSEPQAYGVVTRGFPIRVQEFSGTSAIVPVSSYTLSDSVLPTIPAALSLYRDQGFPADDEHIAKLIKKFRSPFSWQSLGVLPTLEQWYSADRTLEFALDISKRSLTVTVLGSLTHSPQGPADDFSTIAIAKHFLDSLNVDHSSLGSPYITNKGSGEQSKTFVVWPTMFDGVPLVDLDAHPVPALFVEISRLSRKPVSATITFFSPESLSRSSYSRAKTDDLVRGFMSGGLLPASKAASRSAFIASYSSAKFVYILLPANTDYPMYIVPGISAVWMQPTCKGCASIPVETLLPAVDKALFHWYSALPVSGSGSHNLPGKK